MENRKNRAFLKYDYQFDLEDPESIQRLLDKVDSDQGKGIPEPPAEKPYDGKDLIILPSPEDAVLQSRDIFDILNSRESRRVPASPEKKMTLHDVSFLLWAVQGVRTKDNPQKKRTVPSAGGRYPFDTYFLASNVESLAVGLFRYVWSKHALLPVPLMDENIKELTRRFGKAAMTILWVAVPYRCEWRYAQLSYKLCALDAGHMAQNGYLAAEALGIGCCAIGAYSQKDIDRLIGVDGTDEFTCYIEAFV